MIGANTFRWNEKNYNRKYYAWKRWIREKTVDPVNVAVHHVLWKCIVFRKKLSTYEPHEENLVRQVSPKRRFQKHSAADLKNSISTVLDLTVISHVITIRSRHFGDLMKSFRFPERSRLFNETLQISLNPAFTEAPIFACENSTTIL